jgi:nucleoid-associated protein YgaU
MAIINRYGRTGILRNENGDSLYATPEYIRAIRNGVNAGTIIVSEHTAVMNDRLDKIAGRIWGDAALWWIIAAASGIGWGLQIPPGTQLLIPTDLSSITDIIG